MPSARRVGRRRTAAWPRRQGGRDPSMPTRRIRLSMMTVRRADLLSRQLKNRPDAISKGASRLDLRHARGRDGWLKAEVQRFR
jgi:hypothetical protein